MILNWRIAEIAVRNATQHVLYFKKELWKKGAVGDVIF
jgi:hypothetical protein